MNDLIWLENIRAEFLVKREDYPSCSGAFCAVDNAINRLLDELRECAAEDDAKQRLGYDKETRSAAPDLKDETANWRLKSLF